MKLNGCMVIFLKGICNSEILIRLNLEGHNKVLYGREYSSKLSMFSNMSNSHMTRDRRCCPLWFS